MKTIVFQVFSRENISSGSGGFSVTLKVNIIASQSNVTSNNLDLAKNKKLHYLDFKICTQKVELHNPLLNLICAPPYFG